MKKQISVHVKIPATSANMGPGFDVVGVALQFFNEATFIAEGPFSPMRRAPTLRIEVSGEGTGLLPLDATNLVYRAAAHVFEKAKKWPLALHMKLVNRIPLARGMGSSAAAVLAGVIGANTLCGKPLTEQALLDLAVMLEGHPDNIVPAFYGGFCISSLENNETRYLKFPVPAGLYPVVCVPELPLATQKARQVLPSRVAFSAAVYTASHLAFLVGGLLQKRFDLLKFGMSDVLHQPARASLIPGLKEVMDAAYAAGAVGCALSGAGTSVLAIASKKSQVAKIGDAMKQTFLSHGHKGARSLALSFRNKGFEVEKK